MRPRIANLRTYLAGTGATGALIAGAFVAFLGVGALVAFDGLPLGGDGADGTVSLAERPGGLAPESAASALAAASDAVASEPAGGSVLAATPSADGAASGGSGGDATAPTAPTGDGPGGPIPPAAPAPGDGTVVSGAIADVDEGLGDAGVESGLSDAAQPLSREVDRALENVLEGAGDALGQSGLGSSLSD
jgi:hypothetical protein